MNQKTWPVHLLNLSDCSPGRMFRLCGRKKVAEHGYSPDIHLIATEYGVIKSGMEEPRFDEIETLYATVREQIRRSE